jgi:hypothetical protein
MNQSLEGLVADLIGAINEGDYAETARIHRSISTKIRILRDRIDELGGYHDDV